MNPTTWIGLSGAVPEDDELKAHGWSPSGISLFVKRFVDRVMEAGAGVSMGSHLTFMPLILDVARGHYGPKDPKLWRIFVARRYYPTPEEQRAYETRYDSYGAITWVGEVDPPRLDSKGEKLIRQTVLTDLRNQFITASQALVCVGGRPSRSDPRTGAVIEQAGVEEEAEIAWKLKRRLYLVGAGGGYAETVYNAYYDGKLDVSTNGLSVENNRLIARHKDPFQAVSFVLEGLERVGVL